MKVGHINCNTDTCLILEYTIVLHLNNGLKRLIKKHVCNGRVVQDSEYNVAIANENPVYDGNELDLKVKS
jgi:hypothetical protein